MRIPEITELPKAQDTVEVTFTLPKVEGYEYTGEHRSPQLGEYFMNSTGEVKPAVVNFSLFQAPILKKILPKYQKTTLHDVDGGTREVVDIGALRDALALVSYLELSTSLLEGDYKIFQGLRRLVK